MSEITFDRAPRFTELSEWLQQLASDHPELMQLEVLGRSYEGREVWIATVTNTATGPHDEKPAIWLDGNIHATETTASVALLHLLHTLCFHPFHEAGDLQHLRADAIHRRDQAAQHVIAAAVFAGAFQGQQVAGIGHHAEHSRAALRVAADLTAGFSAEVEAGLALAHLAAGGQQGLRKALDLLFRLSQQVQGKPLGCAGTNARQALELID